jgi:hypothetical protein
MTTCQHDVQHDPTRPDVGLFAIVLVVQEHFRGDVVGGAAHSLGPGVYKLILAVPKVANLHVGAGLPGIQQSILQLDVPVPSQIFINERGSISGGRVHALSASIRLRIPVSN